MMSCHHLYIKGEWHACQAKIGKMLDKSGSGPFAYKNCGAQCYIPNLAPNAARGVPPSTGDGVVIFASRINVAPNSTVVEMTSLAREFYEGSDTTLYSYDHYGKQI